ncbi:hypothetical protein, partial [Sphingobium fuliginis]|uniref:hypothetical protein n=1 Tax=Sphingobium fuliginis (strain ATCC 27551) TaxID=336203 RepID=UPI001C306B6B
SGSGSKANIDRQVISGRQHAAPALQGRDDRLPLLIIFLLIDDAVSPQRIEPHQSFFWCRVTVSLFYRLWSSFRQIGDYNLGRSLGFLLSLGHRRYCCDDAKNEAASKKSGKTSNGIPKPAADKEGNANASMRSLVARLVTLTIGADLPCKRNIFPAS